MLFEDTRNLRAASKIARINYIEIFIPKHTPHLMCTAYVLAAEFSKTYKVLCFHLKFSSVAALPSPACSLIKYSTWDEVKHSDLGVWSSLDFTPAFITRMR